MLKVQAIGHLGGDPEMHYTPDGKGVTSFSVAVGRRWKDAAGEQHEQTTWLRCSAWGKLGEICNQYLKKGIRVYIEGRLNPDKNGSPRIWQKQDGTAAASYEVTIHEMEIQTSKAESEAKQQQADLGLEEGPSAPPEPDEATQATATVTPPEDEIPF